MSTATRSLTPPVHAVCNSNSDLARETKISENAKANAMAFQSEFRIKHQKRELSTAESRQEASAEQNRYCEAPMVVAMVRLIEGLVVLLARH